MYRNYSLFRRMGNAKLDADFRQTCFFNNALNFNEKDKHQMCLFYC
jgi:hypothetical protein